MLRTGIFSQAIDTLLFENFETDPDTYIEPNFPNGDDETWVNYDQDGYNDASGAGRPGEWFWSVGFADVDTTTLVYASNSWTTPATLVANYLVLPPLTISDASAQLSWKSAPYQTPRYLDGYYVVASTDCNIEECFTDTLFKAAEFLSAEILIRTAVSAIITLAAAGYMEKMELISNTTTTQRDSLASCNRKP